MTALRRITTPNAGTGMVLQLDVVCDQCNKPRAHGDHRLCSRKRQAEGILRRQQQGVRT